MKKFIWALMVAAATTFSFVACDNKEPEPTPTPTPSEKCEICGNNPCTCPTEEVCPDCGKNPCECTPTPAGPEWCTSLFEVNYTVDETAGYGFDSFDYSTLTNAEGQTIHEYLGFGSWEELAEAIGTIDEAKMFDRETQLFGIDLGSESDILSAYNTNGFGYWVDANGVVDAWGSETVRAYTEAFGSEETGYLAPTCTVGVMPGNISEGDTYKFGMIFQRTAAEVLRAGVQVTIKVEAFKDPEDGKYPTTATAGTFDVDFEGTISLSTLEFAYQGITWEEQFETVKTKLGMTKYQFANPSFENVFDDEGELYTGRALTYTLPDGTTGEGTNVWLNGDNAVTAWGTEDCVICIEWIFNALDMYASSCVFPAEEAFYTPAVQACVGKTFNVTYTITYIPDADADFIPDQDPTIVNMNFAVTIAE